jgi:ankyrin repeat protein
MTLITLSQLLDELLLMVVESLSDQKDIAALVRVKWTLYHRLHTFLCRFNVQHYEGAGLLSVARNGQSSLVQKNFDLGADIASFESQFDDTIHCYEECRNPLLQAAQNDHMETLEILLSETRPSRMCVPSQLRTVLDWAIGAGNQAIVEFMIAHKAPLGSLDDKRNSTPLGTAVKMGCEAISQCLLQAGAKPPSTYCLVDPLTMATHEKPDILLRLVKHGLRPKFVGVLSHRFAKRCCLPSDIDSIRCRDSRV